jgi:choline dehydrogenase-like flavoprotein
LNSESARFPGGLANRSGHVGRHYIKHVFGIVTAIMPQPVNFHRGTQNLGTVDDFVPSDPSRGFLGGFKFEQVAFDPATLANLSRPGAWGTAKDQYGMPVPVIHYVDHENSKRMRQFALQKARELYESLGSESVFFGPPPPATHNMGTCRMATSIDDGVCDLWGRAFDVPNLYLSDGSTFASSGTANPTLTIVTLATRQAAHLRKRMSSRDL